MDKPGLYKLSLRALQNYTEGLSVYRQIAVDGRVPFRELLAYEFPYNREWRLETLHGGDGEPFLFYFAKGTHSIGMTVKMGPAAAVMRALYEDSQALSELLLSIKMITTSDPDPNYDYELEEQIPELLPRLEELAARAADTIALIGKPNGKTPSISNALNQNIDILRSLLKRPDRIAVGLSDLESVQETLSSWYVSLQSMALAVDCFYIVPRDQEAVMEKAGFFDKLGAVLEGLFVSYFRDYNSVGGLAEGNRTLDVWIGRGKEWAEVFKRLTDDSFTPETGVEVRLNVLPASQLSGGGNNTLMLAVTSGNAPDVALGVGAGMPVEFAIRSAAVDLSRLEGFEETFAQFPENIRVPYTYKGGVYGLPETMDFRVLFYRKDILARLGAALPETWDEVYGDLLPLLYQNNMEMYVAADFSMFLYQNGGRYYTEDTARSGLDTPEAFRAFKQTTELFTNYGIPVSASFYNRFRSGIMPVGISGFADYMTLLVAAPEIGGKWGIAPIPGTRREDGGVDHSFSGMAVDGAMILADSEKKQDAWQLLRWWMSAETQVQYARDIEAMIGLSARWSTANVKANDAISWDREDIAVIREQRRWAREIPNVAGGYYTGRYVNNAWNSVVIGGERLRDSLEEAVFAINKELAKKQKQYGTGQEAET